MMRKIRISGLFGIFPFLLMSSILSIAPLTAFADSQASKFRVMRGGAWDVGYDHCTINYRESKNALGGASNLGFRLCLTLP